MRRRRKLTLFAVWIYVLSELGALTTLALLSRFKHIEYQPMPMELTAKTRAALAGLVEAQAVDVWVPSAEIGWTGRPSYCREPNRICQNSRGLRGTREYPENRPPGVARVAAFGDSFTWGCCGLADDEIWTARLEQTIPNLEVLNFGVSAYGLDQEYLRYLKEATWTGADIVFIGFMSENILRGVNTFRPFLYPEEGTPLAKPRFALAGERLVTIANPIGSIEDYADLLDHPSDVLPELGEHDDFYRKAIKPGLFDWSPIARLTKLELQQRRFDSHTGTGCPSNFLCPNVYDDSEAFQLVLATIDRFYDQVQRDGRIPVVVLLPLIEDVTSASDGRPVLDQHLIEHLAQRSLRFVDLVSSLKRQASGVAPAELFDAPTRHYNVAGNQIVANALARYLRDSGLLDLARHR